MTIWYDVINFKQAKRMPVKFITTAVFFLSFNMAVANSITAQDAVSDAINNHPEVQSKWHAFLAAGYSQEAARSGFRPRIDLATGYDYKVQDYGPNSQFNGAFGELTLRQMLYDGSLTRSEVNRFSHLQLVSYFELLESAEQAAFNAFAAYQDILRQRELVELAKNNLNKHYDVFKQVENSARAGVARSADLEQVNGRVSLAKTNLITEMSNLHDISARYLRLVGSLPPGNMQQVELSAQELPDNIRATLLLAYQGSPVYHAALRNILASEQGIVAQRSNFRPKIDLKARYGTQSYDAVGNSPDQSEASIGIELRYNLFNGGRDRANSYRAHQEVNIAKDLRDKACIDVRQSVQISFNDTRKLAEQLPILNQHRVSSDRVATAYKQQFDIGQRTLLDVLDVENEFFQASRAWVNARYDLSIATASTLQHMGKLISGLNLSRAGLPTLADLGADSISVDEATACPAIDIFGQSDVLFDSDGDGVPDIYDQCPNTPKTDLVDERGCSVMVEQHSSKTLNIQFPHSSAEVDNQYLPDIEELATFMARFPDTDIEIQGHSSVGGSERFNLRLSKQRAEAVATILVNTFEVDRDRITAQGYGTSQLLMQGNSPEANSVNRRIEVKVTATSERVLKR